MKRYREYMDSVEVSPKLHEKLTGLSAPRRTARWKKYGALAAALVLVIGEGAFGLSHMGRDAQGQNDILYEVEEWDPEPVQCFALEPVESENALAPAEPGDLETDRGNQVDGGYEVVDGETAEYCYLPAIVYNDGDGTNAADYSLAPEGALSREAGLDDVQALLGGADMAVHLLWDDDWDWSGTLWFLADGTPCAAALWAEGDGVQFYIEMMEGSQVPSCIGYPDNTYETTTYGGVEITALKNTGYLVADGVELRESRVVSCFANGVGYKFTIYGVDGEQVEAMCARFARWAITEGFDLSAVSLDGAVAVDSDNTVAEPNGEGGADTPAYDPEEDSAPSQGPKN